jgi:hypothetical protein
MNIPQLVQCRGIAWAKHGHIPGKGWWGCCRNARRRLREFASGVGGVTIAASLHLSDPANDGD